MPARAGPKTGRGARRRRPAQRTAPAAADDSTAAAAARSGAGSSAPREGAAQASGVSPRRSSRWCSRAVLRWYKRGINTRTCSIAPPGELSVYFLAYACIAAAIALGMAYLTITTTVSVVCGVSVFLGWRVWQRSRGEHDVDYGRRWVDLSELDAEEHYITTRDGVRLRYFTAGAASPGGKTMMIANGLGGSFFFWEPVLRYFVPRGWRVVSWDYRGLFGSAQPLRHRQLAVPESARDAIEIMDELSIDSVDVFIGWSTGVQVGLEICALYPERVERLICLNGTHGQVFATCFQWFFRVPLIADLMYLLLEQLQANLPLLYRLSDMVFNHIWIVRWSYLLPYSLLFGNDMVERAILHYVHNIFEQGQVHTLNYLRTFIELHAHSIFHALRSIEQPTLIISGFLDYLTPAYNSFEMASKMPNAQHVCHFCATHFALIEFPDEVVEDMAAFLEEREPFARKYRRVKGSSDKFERVLTDDER